MAPPPYDGTDSQNHGRSNADRAQRAASDSHSEERGADELAKARDSLRNVPQLSEERIAEIKDRIKHGYYSRSDVLERIAKRLTHHLTQ